MVQDRVWDEDLGWGYEIVYRGHCASNVCQRVEEEIWHGVCVTYFGCCDRS